MKDVGSIGILHVIFLSMTVIGLKNHVTILPPLLDTAQRDGWLSVLFAAVILFFWLFLLVYVQKNTAEAYRGLVTSKNWKNRRYYCDLHNRHLFNYCNCFYNG